MVNGMTAASLGGCKTTHAPVGPRDGEATPWTGARTRRSARCTASSAIAVCTEPFQRAQDMNCKAELTTVPVVSDMQGTAQLCGDATSSTGRSGIWPTVRVHVAALPGWRRRRCPIDGSELVFAEVQREGAGVLTDVVRLGALCKTPSLKSLTCEDTRDKPGFA
jgi:hypothetical protein